MAAAENALQRRIRILVAEDHAVLRQIVTSTLKRHPGFEVCAEAGDGADAVEKAKQLKPDVAILNVTMPVLNGFDAARQIKNALPQTAIVILSSNADKQFLEEARKIGVRAYVAKSKAGHALVNAVEAAVRGQGFVVI